MTGAPTSLLPAIASSSARAEVILGASMVAILGVMILPVPAPLLDVMLSLSVSLSLVVFLFALQIERPLEFSAFPSVLLLTTLLRLALNVASTRRILLHGNEGSDAAGAVIEAFGQFVVGGNTAVGIIIFLILVAINFMVVTKGASRIAEVAARFTLDSMPGKQMAIDADLAAGLCSEQQARARRSAVEQEADFFGSMDGASKFVRGDAVAGLLITFVNVVGGLIVGVLQQHMPAGSAFKTYTALTVGDGLVTQIPALMTSIAAGLVTTRAAAGGSLGLAVTRQLFGGRRSLGIAAAVLGCMSVVPGMPHMAFLLIAAALAALAYRLPRADAATAVGPEPARGPENERAELEATLPLDLLELEVGYELVPMVDSDRDGSLLRRIAALRKTLAVDLGILVPPVHMRDNLRLRANEYRILLGGNPLGRGDLRPGLLLAINGHRVSSNLPGEDVTEPAFGLPARWVASANRQRAELAGFTVVDPPTVVTTHLGELLGQNAYELLGRRELQQLLELHGRDNAKVIEELLPNVLSYGALMRVLRNLLRERVSIRDFRSILEALADSAAETKDADALTELVRQRLARQLTHKHRGPDGTVAALVLAPTVEQIFRRMQTANAGTVTSSQEVQALASAFETAAAGLSRLAETPVIVASADVRRTVSTFSQRYVPDLRVLSFRELEPRATVRTVGIIELQQQTSPQSAISAAKGMAHAV